MLMIILYSFCILLMIFGIVEICHMILIHTYKKSNQTTTILIVPLYSYTDDAEMIIRNVATKIKWNNCVTSRLICLDCGMNDNTKKICENLMFTYSFLEIKTLDELSEILTSLNKGNVV